MDDRRMTPRRDRRATPRGGRRNSDGGKPWYLRRRLWLAVASVIYMGWRRVQRLAPASPPGPVDPTRGPRL